MPWNKHIEVELKKPYFSKLREFVSAERKVKQIYPAPDLIFNAFAQCPYYDLKVVILGNEPYTTGFDHGLAWSETMQRNNPSTFNIFKEVRRDMFVEFENKELAIHKTGNLTQWANQGVLLLNTLLTSEKGIKESHKNKGWEEFTANTIKLINDHPNRVVFMLWGKRLSEYRHLIDESRHLVLEASNPSPHTVQQGFMGCKHFSQANDFISKHYFNKRLPVKWHLF